MCQHCAYVRALSYEKAPPLEQWRRDVTAWVDARWKGYPEVDSQPPDANEPGMTEAKFVALMEVHSVEYTAAWRYGLEQRRRLIRAAMEEFPRPLGDDPHGIFQPC